MKPGQLDKLRSLVKKNPALVWYTNAYDSLNAEAITEAIYNFGSWDEVQALHNILGTAPARSLFTTLMQKRRTNLRPRVQNYFTLYYDRHAS